MSGQLKPKASFLRLLYAGTELYIFILGHIWRHCCLHFKIIDDFINFHVKELFLPEQEANK